MLLLVLVAGALAAVPAGPAAARRSLSPDPPAAGAAGALRPDAFGGPAAARTTEAAVTPELRVATAPAAVAPAVGPALARTPPAAPAPAPVTPPARTVPDVPAQRVAAATSGRAAAHRSARARTHAQTHGNVRRTQLRLPRPSGSFAVPAGLFATPAAAARATAHPERFQAALALLGLVATSGCFLAVAARSRREEAGV